MFTALQIIGSLGLFLFGMKYMSQSLQRLSGDKLRAIMAKMTGNRFKGVFSGFAITSIIQSSSATTVMIVSFVNAGLLTIRQAIGVIMGANLGTTMTAWIIAVFAFKFSLSDIALPIVGIGMILCFTKSQKWKDFGEFLVGFGILFMGLEFLKASIPDIKDTPAIYEALKSLAEYGYFSYIIFLVFGVLATLIVQSSSAAMAITITMTVQGWIGFDLAAAIVLGENIGTTITAMLASLPANRNAKRAAIGHLCFNLIGVIWMLIAFVPVTNMIMGIFPEPKVGMSMDSFEAMRLAAFHTFFNFANICLLIGFVPQIEKIVNMVIKPLDSEKGGEFDSIQLLSTKITDTGELNLFEGRLEISRLAKMTLHMFHNFSNIFNHPSEDLTVAVKENISLEAKSDELAVGLTNYLVGCASHELSVNSANQVSSMMLVVSELEEICDSILKLTKIVKRRYQKDVSLSPIIIESVSEFSDQIEKFISFAVSTFEKETVTDEEMKSAIIIETTMRASLRKMKKQSIKRMEEFGEIKGEIVLIEISNNFEKIASQTQNILQAINRSK